jgi:hypothetical protein
MNIFEDKDGKLRLKQSRLGVYRFNPKKPQSRKVEYSPKLSGALLSSNLDSENSAAHFVHRTSMTPVHQVQSSHRTSMTPVQQVQSFHRTSMAPVLQVHSSHRTSMTPVQQVQSSHRTSMTPVLQVQSFHRTLMAKIPPSEVFFENLL